MENTDITITLIGKTVRVVANTDRGRGFLNGNESTESYIDTLKAYEQLAKENKVTYVINR